MLRSGLVSVSFRKLAFNEVIKLAVNAQLESVEWGGDIHAPPGNLSRARQIRHQCSSEGISVSAYGSYYRAGENCCSFETVLDTASELGANNVRVWAGNTASTDITAGRLAEIVADLARCCDLARPRGITISTEFHSGTLTDTADSCLQMLQEIGRQNLRTYWQPPIGMLAPLAMQGLLKLLPFISNLHVFHWWPTHHERLPLIEGLDFWRDYLSPLRLDDQLHFASLEFIKRDDVDQFYLDAATLRSLLTMEEWA